VLEFHQRLAQIGLQAQFDVYEVDEPRRQGMVTRFTQWAQEIEDLRAAAS